MSHLVFKAVRRSLWVLSIHFEDGHQHVWHIYCMSGDIIIPPPLSLTAVPLQLRPLLWEPFNSNKLCFWVSFLKVTHEQVMDNVTSDNVSKAG